jgi:hypothetical protein
MEAVFIFYPIGRPRLNNFGLTGRRRWDESKASHERMFFLCRRSCRAVALAKFGPGKEKYLSLRVLRASAVKKNVGVIFMFFLGRCVFGSNALTDKA